ncbi:hypothetical protein ACQ4PT_063045 [Festuca glaucescens]
MGEYCAAAAAAAAADGEPAVAVPPPATRRPYGEYDRFSTKQGHRQPPRQHLARPAVQYMTVIYNRLFGCGLACEFVDTEEFQRLRDLKQLGLTYLVYPGAVHTRFEHSLGVYQLAGEAMQNLQMNQGKELGIDRVDVQTVKLAGLLHDIGHGPFSHLFEHEFLPRVDPGSTSKWSHEHMSALLLDNIVDKHAIDIEPDYLKIVKEMIVASSKFSTTEGAKEKRFLYDIVANGRNGVDVDKFDYIDRDSRACGLGSNFQHWRLLQGMRVMGDEICYPAKDYLSVHKLFTTRADLHRTVYTHAKVKAVELMLVDALLEANDYLGIALHAEDPEEFWKLDDTIVKSIETAPNDELKKAKEIIQRIRRRQLYKFCNQYSVPRDKLEHFKDITAQDIVCSQKSSKVLLKEEDIAVSNVKIDLTHGRDNPLESVKFFKVQAVSEAFENLQVRMYGEKTQVHDTPTKKRRMRFD